MCSGLPDSLFSNQKSKFGSILERLSLENADIFYGHLEYFTDIWGILWPFVYIFCSFGAFFSSFGIMYQEKSGNPECVSMCVLHAVVTAAEFLAKIRSSLMK
jgi:hypothetical protein